MDPFILARQQQQAMKTFGFSLDIMGNSGHVFFRYNFQTGQTDFLSDSIEAMSGYHVQEHLDQGLDLWINRIHPEDRPRLVQFYKGCRDGSFSGVSSQMEYRLRHKDGNWVWVSDFTSVIRNSEDQIEAAVGAFRDITELKKHQQMLQSSREQFKWLAEASFVAVATQQDGRIVDVNRQFLDMFGYAEKELSDKQFLDLTAPECRSVVRQKIASKESGPYQAVGLKKDGSTFPVMLQIRNAVYYDKEVMIAVLKDLSQIQRLESRLHKTEERFSTLIEGIVDPVNIFDIGGYFVYLNKSALTGLGITPDAIIGKHVSEIFDPETHEKYWPIVQKVIDTGLPQPTVGIISYEGRRRWFESRYHLNSPVYIYIHCRFFNQYYVTSFIAYPKFNNYISLIVSV
jgi:PAS domain S-box-containing protein